MNGGLAEVKGDGVGFGEADVQVAYVAGQFKYLEGGVSGAAALEGLDGFEGSGEVEVWVGAELAGAADEWRAVLDGSGSSGRGSLTEKESWAADASGGGGVWSVLAKGGVTKLEAERKGSAWDVGSLEGREVEGRARSGWSVGGVEHGAHGVTFHGYLGADRWQQRWREEFCGVFTVAVDVEAEATGLDAGGASCGGKYDPVECQVGGLTRRDGDGRVRLRDEIVSVEADGYRSGSGRGVEARYDVWDEVAGLGGYVARNHGDDVAGRRIAAEVEGHIEVGRSAGIGLGVKRECGEEEGQGER